MTEAEAISKIHEDYEKVRGKLIFTTDVEGYVGNDSTTIYFDEPMLALVTGTSNCELERHMDDGWIDPVWNVDLILPHSSGVRSCWVYGTSYNYKTGEVSPNRTVIMAEPEALLIKVELHCVDGTTVPVWVKRDSPLRDGTWSAHRGG
jgi:hypothetical protein